MSRHRPTFKPSRLTQSVLAALLVMPFAAAHAQTSPESLGTVQAGGQEGQKPQPAKSHEATKLEQTHVFKSDQSIKVLSSRPCKTPAPRMNAHFFLFSCPPNPLRNVIGQTVF